MADKVQFILEDVLEDALYMVRKGVFSQGELQQQMKRRERFEHELTKSTQKVTDFLKAIEYEYQQERVRRYRQDHTEQVKIDPKYKKADTRDFTIVKRIIRLWDRTLHKYRYRIDLWKQYLAFCYIVKSRKTFYKALSNAVKFNPFSLDLWLSGVFYEFEVNKNPWKARKVFHKAIKVNRTNLEFWVEYLRFELMFTQIILERENMIIKDEGQTMKIIGADDSEQEKVEGIDVEGEVAQKKVIQSTNFISLLQTVVEQGLNAIENEQQRQVLMKKMIEVLKDQTLSPLLAETKVTILEHLEQLITDKNILLLTEEENFKHLLEINYKKQYKWLKAQKNSTEKLERKLDYVRFFKTNERVKILSTISIKDLSTQLKQTFYLRWAEVMVDNRKIEEHILSEAIRELCLRKNTLSIIIHKIIDIDASLVFRKLINAKVSFPSSIVAYYFDHSKEANLSKIDTIELMKRIDLEFFKDTNCIRSLAHFNQRIGDTQANVKLMQKLTRGTVEDRQAALVVASAMNQ